jgi:tRNA-binding protein
VSDLSWKEFERVELRVGTVISAEPFPEARKPAYRLKLDFGTDIGTLKSSAQITDHYTPESLLGKQVLAVVNFPKKQIGPFMSECLVTGFVQKDGSVVLAVPDSDVENGLRLA